MTNRLLKVLLFFEAPALAFALSFTTLDDFDVWWHLKCGEMFLREGVIPRTDIFSYTVSGTPWVDGYLPAQALLYFVWWICGPAGVIILGALLVAGAYALALALCRRAGAGLSVALAVAMPAVFLARVGMVPRPALLSPIFALITLWLLEEHRLRGGKRVYWLIPLTALWANCHPGFIMGPALTAIYVTGGVLGDRAIDKAGASKPHRALLDLLLIAQLVATLINPYGYRVYSNAFAIFSNQWMKKIIAEWQPLFSEVKNPDGVIPCFIFMAAIWLASLMYAGRRVRMTHILLFVFLIIASLHSRRNLTLFGPLSLPIIAWSISIGAQQAAPLQRFRSAFAKVGAVMLVAAGLFTIWFVATNRLFFYTRARRAIGIGVNSVSFPVKEVELLKNEPVVGNLLNTYSSGGYVIFKLFPKFRVYMDGRFFPYPYSIFEIEENPLWYVKYFKDVRERYDIRAVLIPVYPRGNWLALGLFLDSPDWAAVDADEWGVLFLARGAGNDAVIKRHEIDLLKDPPALDEPPTTGNFHWFSKAEYPHGPVRWAMYYDSIERPELAVRALKPALHYRPLRISLEKQYDELLKKAAKKGEPGK